MVQRITELETRLAFQDDTLNQLNEVVIQQQRQIELLQQRMQHMQGQLKNLTPSNLASEADETPPPHY